MVADLRYFNSLKNEVDSLKSQLDTQKTQFLNEIDRLSKEYYYTDHMNVIHGVYTTLDKFSDLQCDYVDQVVKCERLEKELSKNLKAQLQDKGIAISELKKLIEKMKGKSVETKFERPSVIRQPDVFKSLRQSVLGKLATFSDSLAKKDFSKSKSVTTNNMTNDFPKQVTTQILPQNVKSILKNTNMIAPGMYKIFLFIFDSGCSKHMTGNLKLLSNFVEKSMGTVKFGNDQIALILGYGDMVQGTITIKRVYYVEGLNHNLFPVGQFCDADLEVAFRKSTCYVCDLKGNDLLTSSRGTDLYSITLQDTSTPNPICLMAKATSSQAWLWHRRLSHLNFDSINLLSKNDIVIGLPKLKFIKDYLCSSCELGKAKGKSFHTKTTPSSKRRLQLLHMDLCGPMRVESINGKKYVLVIIDDYSRYTWTHFLRSKDKTPEVLIDFLRLVQRGLHAQVRTVRTDRGTEFLNKTLHAYFAKESIEHETSTAQTLEQNGVVKRRKRTLVEAAQKMLSAAKVPLFFWTEAIAQQHVLLKTIHSLRPSPQSQENVPQAAEIVTTSNELDLLFSLMLYELLNGTTPVVSKSSVVNATDAPDKCQQQNTTQSSTTTASADIPPLTIHTTPETTNQAPTQVRTVTSIENINQAETQGENTQVEEDEFINIFSTPVQERGETSSRHGDSSNMHTFYQQHPSEHRWTKDHPLEQTDGEMSKGYNQREGIDFKESFAPVALLEAVRLFVAWIRRPTLSYDELSNFLVSKGFSKGSIDPILFITKKGEDISLV
ncbi:retrovirus-related pol polyprotein from transposon TNT 1-94 [Tanacetum coccineum]